VTTIDQAAWPLLEVTDLTKHYPQRAGIFRKRTTLVRAVDGVSFNLERGETFGLVGESGCGKSTLAKTIMMLDSPTSGDVRFLGRSIDASHLGDYRRHAQIVFQDPYSSLPARMRVRDIVADPMRIHGIGNEQEIDQRVQQLLTDVGLDPGRRHEYPFQFSGGQRQRIGIARALAVNPTMLLLDEAVSALDVSVQAQILNLLRDLQDRFDLTYIFISHDLKIVRFMSNRIAVMYLGKIVELGDSDAVTSRPLHPYTVALLSAVPAINQTRSGRIRLAGEPPKPTDPPPGCPFHPRCPMAEDICKLEAPPLREWEPGHHSACHFATDARSLIVQAHLNGA
jgi:oligopeptide transport system ATP-binding protein